MWRASYTEDRELRTIGQLGHLSLRIFKIRIKGTDVNIEICIWKITSALYMNRNVWISNICQTKTM